MTPPAESSLERDLRGVSRDGLYGAVAYLERCGAPVAARPPESGHLRRQADLALAWLAGRGDREQLAAGYEMVLRHSSPVFRD